jgi:putative hydroxymethylpyrimidine transport system substrate-binding protein
MICRFNVSFTMKFVFVLILILSVLACSYDPPELRNDAADQPLEALIQSNVSPTPTTTKISLMLDRYPNAMHAFIYTAVAKGYFLEKGIELVIVQPSESGNALMQVGSGFVDLALASQPEVVMARAKGMPVISVAAVVRHPLNYLMVPKSSPVHSPSNLAGRKVGYPGDAVNVAIMRTMVQFDDGDPEQVIMLDVKRDFVQSVASHQVDAILGGNINEDRILLANRNQPVRVIEPALYGVPEYYELVLVANKGMIETNSELLQIIWEILNRGQQYVLENPEQAIQYVMNRQNPIFPLSMNVEIQSLNMLLPFMANEEDAFGVQSDSVWSDVTNWLNRTGMMEQSVDSKGAYVNLSE